MKKLKFYALTTVLALTFSKDFAQTYHHNFVDSILYVKVKDNFVGTLDLSNILMLPLVPLYHIDTCYRPFMGFGVDSLDRTYCLKFRDINKTKLCMDTLRTLPFVDYVEQVPLHRTSFTPNDLNTGQQWSLVKINAKAAWDVTHGSQSVVIAIIDNGVLTTHEDIAANLWVNTGEIAGNGFDDDLNGYTDDRNGYDVADMDGNPNPPAGINASDPFNHGTHCAGIASGVTDNGMGIASLGFSARIMAVKCTNSADSGNVLTHTTDGIVYAMRAGANIISMSFGSPEKSTTEQLLMTTAHNKGIVLVAAAANDDTSAPSYPAAYTGVISVGATDEQDRKAAFSNYGTTVDVMAPGQSIHSTLASGTNAYGDLSGTSMACPLVAGLASLVLAVHPGFTPDQVEAQIKNNADNISALNPQFAGQLGAGRINAARTLGAPSDIETANFNSNDIIVYPNPFCDQVIIGNKNAVGEVEVEWFDDQGRKVKNTTLDPGNFVQVSTTALVNGIYFLKTTVAGKSSHITLVKAVEGVSTY